MADSQDNILVQKTLKGDTGSYGLLVDRYKNQLFNLAYHLTRNKDDAEDLAQEAFVRAYEHLAKFDQKRSFFTWLYTICTNLTINKLKKKDYYLSEKDWPDQNEINGGITLSVRSSGQLSEAEQKIEEKKKQELLDKLLEKVSAEYRVALISSSISLSYSYSLRNIAVFPYFTFTIYYDSTEMTDIKPTSNLCFRSY